MAREAVGVGRTGPEEPEGVPVPGRARRWRPRIRAGRWLSVLTILAYFGLWTAISSDGFELIEDFKFPSPSTVVESAQDVGLRTVGSNMWTTWRRVAEGIGIGATLGIGIGLLMAYSRVVHYILDPIVEAWRPVPAIAFIPFLLLWFGIDEIGKIILMVMGVGMIMLVSTVEAVRNVPRIYLNAASTLGAARHTTFRTVILPRIVPDLIGPFRVAVALSFTLVVVAELMGSQSGLGFMMLIARRQLDTGVIFLAIFLFGVLSALTDTGVRLIGAYVTRWSERQGGPMTR